MKRSVGVGVKDDKDHIHHIRIMRIYIRNEPTRIEGPYAYERHAYKIILMPFTRWRQLIATPLPLYCLSRID